MYARMLRLEEYDVLTALDAQAGFGQLETGSPDAIILDLRMPDVDGIAFLTRLRAMDRYRHTPVAVITGDYAVDDRVGRQLQELEAELYYKPLWLDDLVGVAQRLLPSRNS